MCKVPEVAWWSYYTYDNDLEEKAPMCTMRGVVYYCRRVVLIVALIVLNFARNFVQNGCSYSRMIGCSTNGIVLPLVVRNGIAVKHRFFLRCSNNSVRSWPV